MKFRRKFFGSLQVRLGKRTQPTDPPFHQCVIVWSPPRYEQITMCTWVATFFTKGMTPVSGRRRQHRASVERYFTLKERAILRQHIAGLKSQMYWKTKTASYVEQQ